LRADLRPLGDGLRADALLPRAVRAGGMAPYGARALGEAATRRSLQRPTSGGPTSL
jgi:hypothetical protein